MRNPTNEAKVDSSLNCSLPSEMREAPPQRGYRKSRILLFLNVSKLDLTKLKKKCHGTSATFQEHTNIRKLSLLFFNIPARAVKVSARADLFARVCFLKCLDTRKTRPIDRVALDNGNSGNVAGCLFQSTTNKRATPTGLETI